MQIEAGLSTVKGDKDRNDDYAAISGEAYFYAIADGIGGARDGDCMSRIGCGASVREYERSGDLAEAFRYANEAAVQASEWLSNPQCGASLLLAEANGNVIRFIGAGDAAAFRLRAGRFERITPLGRIAEGGSLESAIGYDRVCASFERSCPMEPGDRYLLCTDGVWETYSALNIGMLVERLGGESAPSSVAARIVSGAKQLGAHDDATAIVIEVESRSPRGRCAREPFRHTRKSQESICHTMSS